MLNKFLIISCSLRKLSLLFRHYTFLIKLEKLRGPVTLLQQFVERFHSKSLSPDESTTASTFSLILQVYEWGDRVDRTSSHALSAFSFLSYQWAHWKLNEARDAANKGGYVRSSARVMTLHSSFFSSLFSWSALLLSLRSRTIGHARCRVRRHVAATTVDAQQLTKLKWADDCGFCVYRTRPRRVMA